MKNKIISNRQNDSMGWVKTGDAQAKEGRRLQAMESYKTAIKYSTNDTLTVTTLNKLALIQLKLMFYEEAIKTMHEALDKTATNDFETLNNYSEILISYAEPYNTIDSNKRNELRKEALEISNKIKFFINTAINTEEVAYKHKINIPMSPKEENLINNYKKALRNQIQIVFDEHSPYQTINLLKEFIFLFPQENKEWELILGFTERYNNEEHARWQKLHDDYLKDPNLNLKESYKQSLSQKQIIIPVEVL